MTPRLPIALAALAASMALWTGAAAQVVRYDTTAGPPSASLLRRLAASADAYRTGRVVYLVASDTFPHDVIGGFPTFEQAWNIARQRPPHYHVYPTSTAAELPEGLLVVLPGCYKNAQTTEWVCPTDTTRVPVPMDAVQAVELTIHLKVGPPLTTRVSAESVSAFILTVDAFDRFIVPYYTAHFGPEYVTRMREQLLAYARRLRPGGR